MDGVIRGRSHELGILEILVVDLDAFALPDGVPGETDEATEGEIRENDLPGFVGLGAFFVAEREEGVCSVSAPGLRSLASRKRVELW